MDPHITVGAVVSRRTTVDDVAVPPSDVASQVNVVPAVSAATVVGSQPVWEVTAESASWTSQVTETSETYQPLFPAIPVTLDVIAGGEWSPALGRQSQAPRDWSTGTELAPTTKPPPGGHQPNPTRPAIGVPASSVDEVQPSVHSLYPP